ncbi:MAG TPA: molybdenum cofactor guanylyltransferase [Bacillota bacterium]|nr:molybdenum cofactor guanylyltransferase [Bacillota bacterium]
MIDATGLILAGGKSRRMGIDKAFLRVGGDTMIKSIAAGLGKVFSEVMICGGSEDTGRRLGLTVVSDIIEGGGPLGGIHAGLVRARHQKCFVTACDMPFISPELAGYMVEQADGYDIAVPRHGDYLQPLFAVYGKRCIPFIEEALRASRYKIVDFYSKVRVNYVSEEILKRFVDIEIAFFNVNTPSDLKKARSMTWKKGKTGEETC